MGPRSQQNIDEMEDVSLWRIFLFLVLCVSADQLAEVGIPKKESK